MDGKYTKLNNYVTQQVTNLFPKNKVNSHSRENTFIVSVYNKNLPEIFDFGEGKKHERKIELKSWQKEILVHDYFIKGLFHSDGSYYLSNNRDFYNFTNYSKDIIEMYKESCNTLDIKFIEVNYDNGKNRIDHNRRNEVEKLKKLIGTKEIIVY